jgi:phage protein D/phage baseplate assembly protein gpV
VQQYYVPDFEVKIHGLTMEADVKSAVISLTYDNNLDQADMFQLTLNNADLRFTDSPLFDVGKDAEIYMGYANNLQPMMLGEIVAVRPSFPEGGAPTITITGYDKSHRMRHNHKTRAFHFANASLIAAQIAAENLLVPVVDPTSLSFACKTQNSSDMALLKELAGRTFFEVYVHWDKLYFRFPRPQTEAVLLDWGKNLSSFSPRLSTSGQVGLQCVRDYDQKLATTIVGLVPVIGVDTNLGTILEKLGGAFVDQLTSFGQQCLTDEPVESFADAFTFAKAILEELLEGLLEGSGTCIGLPELRAGEMVNIGGVGKKFSGLYRLRQVTHSLSSSGYQTTFEVTQRSSSTMLQLFRKIFEGKPSPNQRRKMDTAVIGTVANNVDPEGLGRVLLRYPWFSDTVVSGWAKVVQPDTGTYFIPDIGEDVWVTFEKGDFDRPVVTGSLWNVHRTPPEVATPENFKKVLRTRLGHRITLDDTPSTGGISLETIGKAKIHLDAEGNVTIEAGPSGTITLKTSGVSLTVGPTAVDVS